MEKKEETHPTGCVCVLLVQDLLSDVAVVLPALSITSKTFWSLRFCLFSLLLACEIFIDDFNRRLGLTFSRKCTAAGKVETRRGSQIWEKK